MKNLPATVGNYLEDHLLAGFFVFPGDVPGDVEEAIAFFLHGKEVLSEVVQVDNGLDNLSRNNRDCFDIDVIISEEVAGRNSLGQAHLIGDAGPDKEFADLEDHCDVCSVVFFLIFAARNYEA